MYGGEGAEGGGVNSLKICWCDDDDDEGWRVGVTGVDYYDDYKR